MHIHQTQFTHGDIVYLKTDQAQIARMVIAITIRINNAAYYELACGPDSSFHFDIEMSCSPDQVLKLGLNEVEK